MCNVQDLHRPRSAPVQQHPPAAFTRPADYIQPGLPYHTASPAYRRSIRRGNTLRIDYDIMNDMNDDSSFYAGSRVVEETQNGANAFLQNQSLHFSN